MKTSHSLGFFFGSISKLKSLDEIYVLLVKTPRFWKGIGTTASDKYPFLYQEDLFLKEVESLMKKNNYHFHLIEKLTKRKIFRPRNIYERTLVFAWLRKVGYFPIEYTELYKSIAGIERRIYWVTAVMTPQGKTIRSINEFRNDKKIASPDGRIEEVATIPIKEALDRLFHQFKNQTAPTYIGLLKGIRRLIAPLKDDELKIELHRYATSLEEAS